MNELSNILSRAEAGNALTDEELGLLLELTDEGERELLFQAARRLREKNFGQKVFLYGFVYFSTYCRNKCRFCYYRCANGQSPRYRKSLPEILEIGTALKESGIHLLDLTMGEDPLYLSNGDEGHERLIEIFREVKKATNLPLMASPGVVPDDVVLKLKEAGADWYALYQETHSRTLYDTLRTEQPYEDRWHAKCFARDNGMLIEEGLLTGIGDSTADRVYSLREMQKLGASQVRTMTFVPQAGTPLGSLIPQGSTREVNLIAVLRLLFPDALIPASLDVEGAGGLKARMQAGANVVTSIIPPQAGLAGVAQAEQDIADGGRTVAGVKPLLEEVGLEPASAGEYADWIARRKALMMERGSGSL
ncbi:MAG: methylornithine synthase PylB [Selenomonadaceae bacterium]|nr:methylornithine synthase PylB [Selenomonadaceae bacterium]